MSELVQLVHMGLRPGRRLDPPPQVIFRPSVNGTSTVRERDGRLVFRVADSLRSAPDEALSGVVAILLCRILRIPESRIEPGLVRAYRQFMLEAGQRSPRQTEHGLAAPRVARGRKHIDPIGAHRSLLESYLRVTLDMDLLLPRVPKLSWSKTVSGHRFGHWDPDHNVVVISQILDDPDVPEFVLDYVLYHELLHIVHPVRMGSGTKRIVHGAAFRRDEKRFPRWKEGDEWIERLAAGHRKARKRRWWGR